MADPSTPPISASAALLTFLVASMGQVLGPWLIIVVCGFGGAMVALLSSPTFPRMGVGIRHLVRGTLLAMLLAGSVAWALMEYGHMPPAEALGFAAAFVGLKADLVLRWLGERFQSVAGGR